jgi:hypothetical protein
VVDDEWLAAATTTAATATPATIAVVEIDPSVPDEPHGHHAAVRSASGPHGHIACIVFGAGAVPLLVPPAVDALSAANTLPDTVIAKAKVNALKFFITQSPSKSCLVYLPDILDPSERLS